MAPSQPQLLPRCDGKVGNVGVARTRRHACFALTLHAPQRGFACANRLQLQANIIAPGISRQQSQSHLLPQQSQEKLIDGSEIEKAVCVPLISVSCRLFKARIGAFRSFPIETLLSYILTMFTKGFCAPE